MSKASCAWRTAYQFRAKLHAPRICFLFIITKANNNIIEFIFEYLCHFLTFVISLKCGFLRPNSPINIVYLCAHPLLNRHGASRKWGRRVYELAGPHKQTASADVGADGASKAGVSYFYGCSGWRDDGVYGDRFRDRRHVGEHRRGLCG
jgi:hypothetical protein